MKTPEFKIRCSAIGQIMGGQMGLTDKQEVELNGLVAKETLTVIQGNKVKDLQFKRDNPQLPEGAKTYCKMWLKSHLFNRKQEIKSKYLDKGNIMEDDSIDMIADQLGLGMLIKNEKNFDEHDFITGTPDIVTKSLVIDSKNSWSWETFPLLDDEINSDYKYQLQGYMELTGLTLSKLCYCLLDTPEHLIRNEAYWYSKNNGYGELTEEMFDDFKRKMTYSDIDVKLKFREYTIIKDDTIIASIKERVMACRKYLDEICKEL